MSLNLSQTTFVVPIKLESHEQGNHLQLCLEYLLNNLNTTVILHEEDQKSRAPKYIPDELLRRCRYHYSAPKTPDFHWARIINDMIRHVETPVVAIYESDVLLPPTNYLESQERILTDQQDMVISFDGRVLDIPAEFHPEIRGTYCLDGVPLEHCRVRDGGAVGGCVFVNKRRYSEAGLENENCRGRGVGAEERVQRVARLGYRVTRIESGPVFRLGNSGTSEASDNYCVSSDRIELERIENFQNGELERYVQTWPWAKSEARSRFRTCVPSRTDGVGAWFSNESPRTTYDEREFSRPDRPVQPGGFPKRIYSLWIQGEASAPDVVKLNWERWSRFNPDYELVVLNLEEALERIGSFPIDLTSLPPQAFSDVLRAKLLKEGGGVWVDASVFPVRPLSDWLDSCLQGCSFFAYEAPAEDRPVSSWFLAAREGSTIASAWWDAAAAYWTRKRTLVTDYDGHGLIPKNPVEAVAPDGGAQKDGYPYFWFHYLFAYLLATDPFFKDAWEACRKKPASVPHSLQVLFRQNSCPTPEEIVTVGRLADMQKMDWRTPYPVQLLDNI